MNAAKEYEKAIRIFSDSKCVTLGKKCTGEYLQIVIKDHGILGYQIIKSHLSLDRKDIRKTKVNSEMIFRMELEDKIYAMIKQGYTVE